jgi:hypothetical protein
MYISSANCRDLVPPVTTRDLIGIDGFATPTGKNDLWIGGADII